MSEFFIPLSLPAEYSDEYFERAEKYFEWGLTYFDEWQQALPPEASPIRYKLQGLIFDNIEAYRWCQDIERAYKRYKAGQTTANIGGQQQILEIDDLNQWLEVGYRFSQHELTEATGIVELDRATNTEFEILDWAAAQKNPLTFIKARQLIAQAKAQAIAFNAKLEAAGEVN